MKHNSILVFLAVGLLCLLLAVSPASSDPIINVVNQHTFVLSNEGTNGFISQMLTGGYGDYNLYEALVAIQQESDPSLSGVITPAFLATLQALPAGSPIFTTQLENVNPGSQAVAISTDGTAQVVSVFGSTYFGQQGTATLNSDIAGVGGALFTHSTSPGGFLTSLVVDGPLSGMTTPYNVFAIGWMPESTPISTPEPASLWLVGAGCLVLLGYALRSRRRNFA